MHVPASKGATLLDTVVSTGLLLVVFVGVSAAFQLSVDVVTNNKARAGAITLGNERLEYIRSLPYDSIGTSGGIPAGGILQSEQVVLNGITYTRRTVVLYADDPKDGTGGADTNGVTTDYKAIKVDVSWIAKHGGTRSVSLVTRVSPITIEQAVPGGTLSLAIIDAGGQPLPGAQVGIVNTTTTPPVNTTLFSGSDGMVTVVGAPPSSGYEITVSLPGYTTARTYPATAENTNPSPGHLTVALNQTTSATFAIDRTAIKNVRTFTPIERRSISDTFASSAGIAAFTDTTLLVGSIALSGTPGDYVSGGTARSVAFATATPITAWGAFSWDDWTPAGTSITYRLYDGTGSTLIPDSQIPGNAAGLTGSPVSLSGVSTSTYQSISVVATLATTDPAETPAIESWSIDFDTGPIPLPDLAFTLRGTKTIGSGPSGSLHLVSTTTTSGSSAGVSIANLEWDSYTISVAPVTGYDIASACEPQPQGLAPGEYQTTDIILEPHTAHSLLVDVRNGSGALVPGASVRLTRPGTDQTEATGSCGQAFFSGLDEGTIGGGNAYSIAVTASGYAPYTADDVTVSGTSRLSVIVN